MDYSDTFDIDFDKAADLFDDYINSCNVIERKYVPPSPLVISTITITGIIGSFVNNNIIYNCLSTNQDIIYLENGNNIRGNKPLKKKKRPKKEKIDRFTKIDKRKRGKGKAFSNQVSLGIKGILPKHKKPINVKLFTNGGLHMAGPRSLEEAKLILDIIIKQINTISLKHLIQGTKKYINIQPIENIRTKDNSELTINMINSTFQTNFKIEQIKLFNLLQKTYEITDVFTTYNNCMSSPVRVYLKCFSEYDKKKKRYKQPSLFVYRSGSINIVVHNMDLLDKAYNFINEFLKKNFEEIVQIDIDLIPEL